MAEVGASMIAIDPSCTTFCTAPAYCTGSTRHTPMAQPATGGAAVLRLFKPWPGGSMRGAFNPTFPAVFPRFVQHAIWRYCAQSGLAVCNGNRIDDRKSCDNVYCQIHNICDRIALIII